MPCAKLSLGSTVCQFRALVIWTASSILSSPAHRQLLLGYRAAPLNLLHSNTQAICRSKHLLFASAWHSLGTGRQERSLYLNTNCIFKSMIHLWPREWAQWDPERSPRPGFNRPIVPHACSSLPFSPASWSTTETHSCDLRSTFRVIKAWIILCNYHPPAVFPRAKPRVSADPRQGHACRPVLEWSLLHYIACGKKQLLPQPACNLHG